MGTERHSVGSTGPQEPRPNPTPFTGPIGADIPAVTRIVDPRATMGTPDAQGLLARPGHQGFVRDRGTETTVLGSVARDLDAPTTRITRTQLPIPELVLPMYTRVVSGADSEEPFADSTSMTIDTVGIGQMDLFVEGEDDNHERKTNLSVESHDLPEAIDTANYEPEYTESFGQRFRKSLKSKAKWTGINMVAGAPVLLAENYLNNTHITHAAAVGSYVALMATLVAVGERITHKQLNDGHSPSWGAPLGHAFAARLSSMKERIAQLTYAGYGVEVVAEEVLYTLPAVAAALSFGVNAGAGVATGGALVSIASNIAKHHSLKEHSGDPILLKKIRGKLDTKNHVVENYTSAKNQVVEIFSRIRHGKTTPETDLDEAV